MTLYMSGYRFEPGKPFNQQLDEYGIKEELQERADRMWGKVEGLIRAVQQDLSLEVQFHVKNGVDAIGRFLGKHSEDCALAGVWIGLTRVDSKPYQWSDYEYFKSFQKGVRTSSCVLSRHMQHDVDWFNQYYKPVRNERVASQHHGRNWAAECSVGEALNLYGSFQTLHSIAVNMKQRSIDFVLGNHIPGHDPSAPDRTVHYARPDETAGLVKELLGDKEA